MISASNEHLQQQLEFTLLKPDCHSWWISKMQSGRQDTLQERYAIKFWFKRGKNATETYGILHTVLEHLAWIKHQFFEWHKRFKEGRESVKDDERSGRSKESIDRNWLAKGLGLGLLCWGFKEVQEEIPSEEASTLQIRSVAFPAGQCTSPQLHPCHRLFDQDGHQDSSSSTLAPCNFWLFPKLRSCYETIEEMKEAVTKVIDTLTQRYNIAAGGDYFEGD